MRMHLKMPILLAVMSCHLYAAGSAAAQPPRRVATPAARFNLDTPIATLVAHPAARAAFDRLLPNFRTSPHFPQFRNMSLRQLSTDPHVRIPASRLRTLEAELARIR